MPEKSASIAAFVEYPGERSNRPRLLDLFCGAGGAAMGYHRAGFEVVGVDIKPQPHYPFEFIQGDVLELFERGPVVGRMPRLPRQFDAIHASPPCQAYSPLKRMWNSRQHPDLVATVRDHLMAIGVPFVIENVPGAPLVDPITLCGTMFELGFEGADLRRHRLFEIHPRPALSLLPACVHGGRLTIGVYGGGGFHSKRPRTVAVYGHTGGYSKRQAAKTVGSPQQFPVSARRVAMGIDWMTNQELSQAIPPAYTEWVGGQLMGYLTERPLAAAQG